MAEDMRTKAYPPLPPKGSGPRIAIVLPTSGDLRLRSLLPDAFQQQLVVHASAATAPLYARFVVVRRFIVMSSDGDLFTQTVRATLELKDLPRQQLLSLPSISPWDIVKVLDLVQCFSASASAWWELVRVRWKSGMTTWLPIELLQLNFDNLLQEFYVNSINSWGFRDRIYAESIRSFQTEVELWLHHGEFRKFYQFLRQRRAMAVAGETVHRHSSAASASANSHRPDGPDVKPVMKRPILQPHSVRPAPLPPVPSYDGLELNRYQQQLQERLQNHRQQQQQQQAQQQRHEEQRQQHVQQQAQQQREEKRLQQHYRLQQQGGQQQQGQEPQGARRSAAPQQRTDAVQAGQKRVDSRQSVPNHTASRPERMETTQTKLTSHSTSRVPPHLQSLVIEQAHALTSRAKAASPPRSSSSEVQRQSPDENATEESSVGGDNGSSSKQFKRLRKRHAPDDGSDSDDVDAVLLKVSQSSTPDSSSSAGSRTTLVTIIDEEDEAAKDDADKNAPAVIGDIRCACGADSVGTYAGKWLHCWNDECGIWEHADCVGLLSTDDLAPRYICSNCDPLTSQTRRAAAKRRLVDWLFQCCESKNSVQLLKLLRANPSQESAGGWRNAKEQNMTLLMKTARFGLLQCVQYLVHVAKVDVFATDSASLNALHHAVLGGKRRCVQYLLNQEPKLLHHQDKRGRTPFHCLLESAVLNDICLELLVKDGSLAVVGDFESNSPIHYVCRAITSATVEIIRILLQDQSMTLNETSSDGLSPFLLLCKADTGKLSHTAAAGLVREVVKMMLDIDVLGMFFGTRTSNGWTGLHFAAAAGNHELVSFLARCEFVDIHATTTDTSETALHVAAKAGRALCVRELLRAGSKENAKDTQGWIPMLHAESAACLQELLPYKLTKQISRLNRMSAKFQQKDVVRQWQRRIALDPTCFDMVNDWCQSDLERIARMEGIFLKSPFMLRLDNKLDYLHKFAFPALRARQRPSSSSSKAHADVGADSSPVAATEDPREGIRFVFSSSRESCWKQFVGMAKHLEPEVFRSPMQFTNDVSESGNNEDDTSLKFMLIRMVGGLSATAPGFLLHRTGAPADSFSHPEHSEQEQLEKLLDFYLLGELVAHLVLYGVSLSDILNFTPSFLRCVFGHAAATRDGAEEESADGPSWRLYGRSFAGGFEHVAPSVLKVLHPEEFRVLLHGRTNWLDARAVNWERALDWSAAGGGEGVEMRSWWSRLLLELGIEEQQLVLLMLAGSFPVAKQVLVLENKGGNAAMQALRSRIRVVWFPLSEVEEGSTFLCDADAVGAQSDALMPFVDHANHVLSLPRYSSYTAFKAALLRSLRHSDEAFRRR